DSRNSDLDQERIGFAVNTETIPDTTLLTFTNDRWAQYKAYILSPSTVKIECWGRWNASTDEFEHYYDVCVINPNDPSSGFVWADDTHSVFFVTMEDKNNDNWKRDSARVGFSVDPASITDASLFTFTNDRWAQYRAYAITPSLIKIECWGRWNASTDDFEHYYDIGVVDVNDSSSDFSWTDDTHLAFFLTMEDEQNDNWKRESEKIGFSVDPETIPNTAQYTYLHDNWNLYKAYTISPNMIRIALWGRWNYNTDDFELYYDIGTIQVDDPTNDFEWSDNKFTSFSVSIIDYNNDDLDSLTRIRFELDKESGNVSAMATTAPKVTATPPTTTEIPNTDQVVTSVVIPDSQKNIEANWNESDFRYKVNSDGTAKLTKYSGNASTLVIAEEIDGHPIKEIGERTFSHNRTLKSIIVPSNVSIIGDHAFSFADKLEEITIIGPVDKIEDNAFYNCTRLETVTVCGSNMTIGERAFSHCSKLRNVIVLGSVNEIEEHAFSFCSKLESVSPITGLLKLKNNAFYNCTSLKSIQLVGQDLIVEERAFSHCSSIKDITIAGSLSKLDTHAFSFCSKLEAITLAKGLSKIGDSAFSSCSRLKTINYCGSKDEWNAISVGNYNRPLNSANVVYDYKVPDLPSVDQAETVKQDKTASTNEVTATPAPSSTPVTTQSETISHDGNFPAVQSATYTDIKWSGELGYVATDNNSALIVDCSPNADSVSISSEIGGLTVTGIGDGAFEGCTKLKDVYIWADIASIGNNAFKGCSSLEEISIPASVKTIGVSAFENCSELENAYIWGDPESIPDFAFKNCINLEEISIPSGTKSIGVSAFEGCINLENAYIWGDSEIGDSAFKGCTSLKEISISSGIETIGVSAFAGCISLKDVYIWGDSDISAYAFQGCTSIEEISISSGVDLIDDYAFEGCTSLREVLVWGNNTYISDTAFLNCPNLSRIPRSSNTTKPAKKQTAVTSTPVPADTSTTVPSPTPKLKETATPRPSEQKEVVPVSNSGGKYPEGTYLVGRDIAPGKYLFTGTGPADIYYSCPDDKFNDDTYVKEGSIWKAGDSAVIDLKDNTYFMITLHPIQIDLYEVAITDDQAYELPVGTYHVGTDIAPGSYLFVGTGPADILLNCKDDNFLEGTFVKEGSIWKAGDSAVLDLKDNTYFQVTLHAVNISKYQFSLSEDEEKELPVGIYHVGTDIPEGKYYFIGKSTTDILYNCPDNSFTEGTYVKEGSIWSDKDIVLLNLVKDTYVYVQLHAVNIKRFSGITIESDGATLPVGIYRVGEDFPAGAYTFVGTGAADILYNCKDDQFRDGTYEKDGSIWSAGNTTKLTLKDNTYIQITIKPVIIKK
ncbi:MAG: leucine-rich repeat domain-containing protein, partial [Bacillota bacterium]|nr:leucine-rich repeat domain-containing protein [Bacillota bacterium]